MFRKVKKCQEIINNSICLSQKEKIILIVLLLSSYITGIFLSWSIIGIYGVTIVNGNGFWGSIQLLWQQNPMLISLKLLTLTIFYGSLVYPLAIRKIRR